MNLMSRSCTKYCKVYRIKESEGAKVVARVEDRVLVCFGGELERKGHLEELGLDEELY